MTFEAYVYFEIYNLARVKIQELDIQLDVCIYGFATVMIITTTNHTQLY